MQVVATQIREGMVLDLDGELYRVTYTQHVTPGKGVACMLTKLKHIITGKKHQTGHNVSHSNIKSKRRFMVNLNSVTLFSESLQRKFRLRIASSTLRTIDKHGGLDQYLNKTSSRSLTDKALKIKKQIEKNVSKKAS